jgi:hypothetical protein
MEPVRPVPAAWPRDELAALETPEAIRAHFDTLVGPAQRAAYTAYGVLCDQQHRPQVNRAVDGCPEHPSVQECARLVGGFAEALSAEDPSGTLLLGVTRPGPDQVTASDRRWFQGLNRACAVHDVRPLGAYVLTPTGTFPVTLDDIL